MASIYRLGTSELGMRLERLSMLESAFCHSGFKSGCANASWRLEWVRKQALRLKARWFDAFHDEMEARRRAQLAKQGEGPPEPKLVKRFTKHPTDMATVAAWVASRASST